MFIFESKLRDVWIYYEEVIPFYIYFFGFFSLTLLLTIFSLAVYKINNRFMEKYILDKMKRVY